MFRAISARESSHIAGGCIRGRHKVPLIIQHGNESEATRSALKESGKGEAVREKSYRLSASKA